MTTTTTSVSRYLIVVDVEADDGVHRIAIDHRDRTWRCVTCQSGRRCKHVLTARHAAADARLDPIPAMEATS